MTRWVKIQQSVWLHYGLISLVVMLPLLLPGYILTLDLVFTPQLLWPTQISNTSAFEAILHVVNFVLPSQVIEKILLLAILILSGVGAHKLVQLAATRFTTQYIRWGAYVAGLLYMVNPFVYSRFMAGQHLVLLGYALTPFLVISLMRFVERPNWRTSLAVAAWATAIAGVSAHHIGIGLVLGLWFMGALVWRYHKQGEHLVKLAGFALVTLAIIAIANSYWLAPTLNGHTAISQATNNFGSQAFDAFTTNDQGALGAIGNVLRLQGFWADSRGMYILPQEQIKAWGLVVLVLWLIVGVGAVGLWRKNKAVTLALAGAGLSAVLLATTPLISQLSQVVPLLAGYREPQKFVAILALVYTVFAGVGTMVVLKKLEHYNTRAITAAACGLLALPVLCAPTMVWGFGGQLHPVDYPPDWYAMNVRLSKDRSVKKVLFLPWHQYINFSFSGRIIANPASKFFDVLTTSGDNPEFKNLKPTVPNSLNREVEQQVLAQGDKSTTLGVTLRKLGFSHVLLAKEYDYQNYVYLDHQSDLVLVSETPTLKLYAFPNRKEHADD